MQRARQPRERVGAIPRQGRRVSTDGAALIVTGITVGTRAALPMGMRALIGTVISLMRPRPDSPDRPRKPMPPSTRIAVDFFNEVSSRSISRLSGSVSLIEPTARPACPATAAASSPSPRCWHCSRRPAGARVEFLRHQDGRRSSGGSGLGRQDGGVARDGRSSDITSARPGAPSLLGAEAFFAATRRSNSAMNSASALPPGGRSDDRATAPPPVLPGTTAAR